MVIINLSIYTFVFFVTLFVQLFVYLLISVFVLAPNCSLFLCSTQIKHILKFIYNNDINTQFFLGFLSFFFFFVKGITLKIQV